ncbi:enhancer of split M2 protein [Musca domestica]|uniref:Enhancer of split M2 protein n=1 Tax=Musca domestica TaxID=7370 RepID=A0A1I8MZB7_MUSDO|nr:enhancer of split M2 protein [Musca domestica]
MYTDTKNLANLCINQSNSAMKLSNHQQQQQLLLQEQQQSDKFKLKKMWKPILRLMALKSANSASKSNRSLPNNVNLNNAQICHSTPKDLLFSAEQEQRLQEAVEEKFPEILQETEVKEISNTTSPVYHPKVGSNAKETQEFISRVSVDKTPLNCCSTNCVYGRNCQHSQYHQMEQNTTSSINHNTATTPSTQLQRQNLLLDEDFNFINAEDGCFVWSNTPSGDIDEQLLRDWYWHNSWQFAENATMC